jgi:hypothetical protein
MRNAVGALALALMLIGLPSNYDDLRKWRGWASQFLGDHYAPIFVVFGIALLLLWLFWSRVFPRREPLATSGVVIDSRHQSGGQTGLINIALSGTTEMSGAEKAHRIALESELDALSHSLHKSVNRWYTASVEGRRKDAEVSRTEAETRYTETNSAVIQKVGLSAGSLFRKTNANEPYNLPHLGRLPDGAAINRMWYRVQRLDEIVRRVRNGEEPINWPTT